MDSPRRSQLEDLLKDLDRDLNAGLDFTGLEIHSKTSVWWRCEKDHIYRTSVYSRFRSNGRKECNKVARWAQLKQKHQQSGRWKRLAGTANQEILGLWAKDLNAVLIEDVSAGSHTKYKWRCNKSHVWEASPISLMRGTRCPVCAKDGIAARVRNAAVNRSGSLYDARPDLRDQWDPANKIDMREVSVGSNTRVGWVCKYGHKWEATISNRIGRSSGCPYCINQTSRLEIYLLVQLRSVFDDVSWREKIDGKEVDILLTKESIGIEVDGEYWHRNKVDADSAKERYLES